MNKIEAWDVRPSYNQEPKSLPVKLLRNLMWPFKKESPPRPLSIEVNAEGVQNSEGFGVFSPLLQGSIEYLSLLHLDGSEATQAISSIIKCCDLVSNPYQEISSLLRQINWRPHLVGAVAIATLPHHTETTRELWSAIDRGSWVTPQLAAAALFRDTMFADHARERLRSGCLIDSSAYARLSAVEHHIATGPAGTGQRSAKAAAALVRLLELLPHQPAWLTTETASANLQNLLKRDIDSSADIAERWLTRLEHHLAQLGIRNKWA